MATSSGDHPSQALATFAVQAGPGVGEQLPIRLPSLVIGRGAQSHLVLADDSVSTTHARLDYEHGGWRLTDLNSTNGTFVEGVRLAPEVPTPLPYGSTVRFGGVQLHFRPVEGADPEAARASYTPPAVTPPLSERSAGFRLPVWVVAVLLILALLAVALVTRPRQRPAEPEPATPTPTATHGSGSSSASPPSPS